MPRRVYWSVPQIIGSEVNQMLRPFMFVMSCAVLLFSGCKSGGDVAQERVAELDASSTMAWLFPPMTDEERIRLMNPPPLESIFTEVTPKQTITADQVPEPTSVPFDDPDHVYAYNAYYRRAYVWAANMSGYSFITCCLSIRDGGLARAIVKGHYAGLRAAHRSKTMSWTAEGQD